MADEKEQLPTSTPFTLDQMSPYTTRTLASDYIVFVLRITSITQINSETRRIKRNELSPSSHTPAKERNARDLFTPPPPDDE
jgi:hypothetical protein